MGFKSVFKGLNIIYSWCQSDTPTTPTRDCTCSRKHSPLAQDIITSNRFYCVTKQRSNNILIYFNNFMELWF